MTLTLAALPTNAGLVATLGLLAVGYVLSGIPNVVGSAAKGKTLIGVLGGWFLVASALFAYYMGAALVVNSNWGRTVLPIGGEP